MWRLREEVYYTLRGMGVDRQAAIAATRAAVVFSVAAQPWPAAELRVVAVFQGLAVIAIPRGARKA